MFEFRNIFQRATVVAILIGMTFLVTWVDPVRGGNANTVDVWFFDIGQGDAVLIQSGSTQIMIDGGPTGSLTEKVGRVMPFWDNVIEYTFVSHPHEDHFIGFLPLAQHYDMDHIYVAPQIYASQSWQVFLDTHDEEVLMAGDEIHISEDISVQVIWPEHRDVRTYEDANDGSLVLIVNIQGKKILFTGDAGVEQEKEFLEMVGDVDVLKVGHHGSYTSTSPALLDVIDAEQAIISCGQDNSYGHPNAVVVNRLNEANIETWRTDQDGDIRMQIRQGIYHISSFSL